LVDGQVSIESQPRRGTTIHARAPQSLRSRVRWPATSRRHPRARFPRRRRAPLACILDRLLPFGTQGCGSRSKNAQ
jgi:hypothetical protein